MTAEVHAPTNGREAAGRGVVVDTPSDSQRGLHNDDSAGEGRFRALVANLQVGVLVQGPAAEIRLCNERALDLLGVDVDQLLGLTSFDPSWGVIHEDGSEFPGPTHPVPVAIAEKRPVRGVVMGVYRPTKRDRVWLLVNAEPRLDEAGAVKEVICTFSDMTERKLLGEKLARRAQLDSLGFLAGSVAHDFNNLLTVIRHYTELAQFGLSEQPQAREDLDRVISACERAGLLTEKLLTFGHKRQARARLVDALEVLKEAQPIFEGIMGERVDFEFDWPDGRAPVLVDPAMLEHAVVNLLANARDAVANQGKVTLRARVLADANRCLEIEVEDDGPGVAPDLIDRVYEPFFTTKGPGRGTGLGLSVVQSMTEQAGGNFTITSPPHEHTRAVIRLPLQSASVAGGEPTKARERKPVVSRGTILVVEDDDSIRLALTRLLTSHGHRVLVASGVHEGLSLLDSHPSDLDLLLVDVVLHTGSGLEVVERARQQSPKLPILYMSGYSPLTLKEMGVDTERVDFLAKPFGLDELASHVERLLLSSRSIQEGDVAS